MDLLCVQVIYALSTFFLFWESFTAFYMASVCRPVESHSGAQGNILAGPPNILVGAPLGRKF